MSADKPTIGTVIDEIYRQLESRKMDPDQYRFLVSVNAREWYVRAQSLDASNSVPAKPAGGLRLCVVTRHLLRKLVNDAVLPSEVIEHFADSLIEALRAEMRKPAQ